MGKLPEAMQKVEDEVNQMEAAMRATAQNPGGGQDNSQLDKADEIGQNQPLSNDEPAKSEQNTDLGEVVEQPAAKDQQDASAEKAAEHVEDKTDIDYWQRRFLTNQGMQKAEKERHEDEIRTLSQKLEEQNALLNRLLENKSVPEKQNVAPTEMNVENLFTQEERDQFDPDTLALLPKLMARMIKPDQVSEKLSAVEQRMSDFQAKTEAESRMAKQSQTWGEVEKLSPGAFAMKDDSDFVDWLKTTEDEIAGKPLLTLVNQAFDEGRANSVSRIFNAYKSMKQASSAPKKGSAPANIDPAGNGGADATTHLKDNRKPVYTNAEIDKRSDEAVRLTRIGKHAEAEAIMKENDAAYRERRIKQ